MSRGKGTIGAIAAAVLRHVATAASGLLTIPLVVRAMGADGVAAWTLLGVAAFALGVADLGMGVAIQRAAARGDQDAVRRAIGISITTVLVIAPLLALGSYTFLLDLESAPAALAADLARAAPVALVGGVVAALAFPFRALAVVRGAMRPLAWARGLASALQIGVTAGGLAWRPSLMAPAVALLVAAVVETAITAATARSIDREVPLDPRLPRSLGELGGLLNQGAATVAVNAAAMVALRFDVVVLSRVAPLAVVAAYGVAFRAVDQSFTLAKQASAALMPRLARAEERTQATRFGTALLGGVVASGMAALATQGDGLLVAWAGDAARHPDTAVALALLAAGAVVAAGHEVVASALTLGGRSAWRAALPLTVGYAVNVAVTFAGASRYGVVAVAGGTLLGNIVTSVLLWRRAGEVVGGGSGFAVRALAPVGLAGLAALIVGVSIGRLPFEGLLASLLGCLLATSAGLAAMGAARRSFA